MPAPGSRWAHKSGRRFVIVVRVRASLANATNDVVDYRYERTVGGMGRDRTTPVQSMALETWRSIFTKPAPPVKRGAP